MVPIDYGKYSKADLKEAFQAIDSMAYPENHAALVAEFGKRNLRIPRKPGTRKPQREKPGISTKLLLLAPPGLMMAWAMVGLGRNSLYLPGKGGGTTFTGTGLKLAVLAITLLAVSSAYVTLKPQSIKGKANLDFYYFFLFILLALLVWAGLKSHNP